MLVKDVFSTGNIYFLDKKRPVVAGLSDGLGDGALCLSAGVGAVNIASSGVSVESILILLVLIAGSLAGTVLGYRLASALNLATERTT